MFWLSYEQNVKTVSYSCVNDESMSASSASSSDFSVTKWVWSSLLRHNFLPVFSLECVTWFTIIIFTLESCNIISGWVTQLRFKSKFESKNLRLEFCVMLERLNWFEKTSSLLAHVHNLHHPQELYQVHPGLL